jgi:hypothetical protein
MQLQPFWRAKMSIVNGRVIGIVPGSRVVASERLATMGLLDIVVAAKMVDGGRTQARIPQL